MYVEPVTYPALSTRAKRQTLEILERLEKRREFPRQTDNIPFLVNSLVNETPITIGSGTATVTGIVRAVFKEENHVFAEIEIDYDSAMGSKVVTFKVS